MRDVLDLAALYDKGGGVLTFTLDRLQLNLDEARKQVSKANRRHVEAVRSARALRRVERSLLARAGRAKLLSRKLELERRAVQAGFRAEAAGEAVVERRELLDDAKAALDAARAGASPASFAPPAGALFGTASHAGGYVFPVGGGPSVVSVSEYHHDYPAADIAAPMGAPLYALADGVVEDAWPLGSGNCGIGFVLGTADGRSWTYCHLSFLEPAVQPGASLAAGAPGRPRRLDGPLDRPAPAPPDRAGADLTRSRRGGSAPSPAPRSRGRDWSRPSRTRSRRCRPHASSPWSTSRSSRSSPTTMSSSSPSPLESHEGSADKGVVVAARLPSVFARIVALTAILVLGSATISFAADSKFGAATTPNKVTVAPPRLVTIPDVRGQAYVFAKGTLEEGGFAWRVAGAVQGTRPTPSSRRCPPPGPAWSTPACRPSSSGLPATGAMPRRVRRRTRRPTTERRSSFPAGEARREAEVQAEAGRRSRSRQAEASGQAQARRQADRHVQRPSSSPGTGRAARRGAADDAREEPRALARDAPHPDHCERQSLALPARVDRDRRAVRMVAWRPGPRDPDPGRRAGAAPVEDRLEERSRRERARSPPCARSRDDQPPPPARLRARLLAARARPGRGDPERRPHGAHRPLRPGDERRVPDERALPGAAVRARRRRQDAPRDPLRQRDHADRRVRVDHGHAARAVPDRPAGRR